MITIENDILITLVGAVVVVLTTVFQIWGLRRAKFEHHRKMLALENTLNEGNALNEDHLTACKTKKCSLFCNVNHLLQIIFGILVFVSFTCWAVYLVSLGLIEWALLPSALALIGLATPILTWRAFKHRHQAIAQMTQDIETCKRAGLEEDKNASEHAEPVEIINPEAPKVSDPVSPVIVNTGVVAKTEETVNQVVFETVVLPEKRIEIQSKPVVIEKQAIPQDSTLRRHFLTTLRAQVESGFPPRPSDSILKRQYEHLIVTQMAKYVDEPIETAIKEATTAKSIEPAVSSEPIVIAPTTLPDNTNVQKQKLPQDSILRRHFLCQLENEIKSRLPATPTDSILKRHFSSLILGELMKEMGKLDA